MSITNEQTKEKYRQRDILVRSLAALPIISPSVLIGVDRPGRCIVASDLWGKCAEETREILLNDIHPWVRSCAEISLREPKHEPMYFTFNSNGEVSPSARNFR